MAVACALVQRYCAETRLQPCRGVCAAGTHVEETGPPTSALIQPSILLNFLLSLLLLLRMEDGLMHCLQDASATRVVVHTRVRGAEYSRRLVEAAPPLPYSFYDASAPT